MKGPKSDWNPKKLAADEHRDLRTINAWAFELYKWALIITDEARQFEATQEAAADHIPDPPKPPFDEGI